MGNLNLNEQRKIAKMCAKKGMPLSDLKSIGIDISEFPLEVQAELQAIYASNRIDKSIADALHDEER